MGQAFGRRVGQGLDHYAIPGFGVGQGAGPGRSAQGASAQPQGEVLVLEKGGDLDITHPRRSRAHQGLGEQAPRQPRGRGIAQPLTGVEVGADGCDARFGVIAGGRQAARIGRELGGGGQGGGRGQGLDFGDGEAALFGSIGQAAPDQQLGAPGQGEGHGPVGVLGFDFQVQGDEP